MTYLLIKRKEINVGSDKVRKWGDRLLTFVSPSRSSVGRSTVERDKARIPLSRMTRPPAMTGSNWLTLAHLQSSGTIVVAFLLGTTARAEAINRGRSIKNSQLEVLKANSERTLLSRDPVKTRFGLVYDLYFRVRWNHRKRVVRTC